MARPTTLKGSRVLIQLGDGEVSEVFAAPCALTTKGISFSAESNDFAVADCENPDLPSWQERVVSTLSAGVSGSGTLAMESLEAWRDWFLSGDAKNIRVKLDAPLADGGGHFSMSAILTSLNLTGEVGGLAQIEVEIASNGIVLWQDATA